MERLKPVHKAIPQVLAVGVGTFGRAVLEAARLDQWNIPQPPVLVLATPGGWENLPALDGAGEEDIPDAEEWRETYQKPGRAFLLKALQSRQAGVDRSDGLAFVIVAHLQEPFGGQIWLPVLQTLSRLSLFPYRSSVTLLFGTNTSALLDADEDARQAFQARLAELSNVLQEPPQGEASGATCGIDWCYLVDTLDVEGLPLRSLHGNGGTSEDVQIHQAARFIGWMANGLVNHPAYLRTRSEQTRRDDPSQRSSAWVGSFAAGKYCFPFKVMQPEAALRLASAVLSEGLIGEMQPTDLAWSKETRRRWIEACGLERDVLANRLLHGRSGRLAEFSLALPDLRGVLPQMLVQRLDTWRAELDQRWKREDSWLAMITSNQGEETDAAIRWLAENPGRELIRSARGGLRARLFVQEAQKSLERISSVTQQLTPAKPGRWWEVLWQKWNGIVRKIYPGIAMDFETARALLEKSIAARNTYSTFWSAAVQSGLQNTVRVARGAIWFFLCGLLSVFLIGPALAPFYAAVGAVLFGATWLRDLIRPAWYVLMNEFQLQRAYHRYLQVTQEGYRERMRQSLFDAQNALYADLLTALQRLSERGEAQMERLRLAEHVLQSLVPHAASSMHTDRVFSITAPTPIDQAFYDTGATKTLAERFLNEVADGIEAMMPEDLAQRLACFAGSSLRKKDSVVHFKTRLREAYQYTFPIAEPPSDPVTAWMLDLLDHLMPALPLYRPVMDAERAAGDVLLHRFASIPTEGEFTNFLPDDSAQKETSSVPFEQVSSIDQEGLHGLVLLHKIDLEHWAAGWQARSKC